MKLYTEEEAKKRKEEIYKQYPFVPINKDTPFEITRKAFLDNLERGLLIDEVNAHTEHKQHTGLCDTLGIKPEIEHLKRNSKEVSK